MKKELINFIRENNLSPFNNQKTQLKLNNESFFKTRDAKSVHNKVLAKISSHFIFPDTSNLLNFFSFTGDINQVMQRQNFFKEITRESENNFLKNLAMPKSWWKPRYDVVIVTEDTNTFNELKNKNCPVQLIISETDVSLLESRDIVQVIDCDEYGRALESLPQSVFLNSIEEAYVERYVETLSGWQNNLELLNEAKLNENLHYLIEKLNPLLKLTGDEQSKVITKEEAEEKLEIINKNVSLGIKDLMISGESLVEMFSKGNLPEEIKKEVQNQIKESNLPFEILQIGVPVKLDEEELDKTIQRQNANEYTNIAEQIKNYAQELKEIPRMLETLANNLILFDFISGISKFIKDKTTFPEMAEEFVISNSKNIFLDNAHPICFNLNRKEKCSILTGANSGGKTTLIEHIIQTISLFNLGLPVNGEIKMPLFSEIYYFAKNKGSMSKGAFETLLSQMSKINPGNKTLILADEIEAVTEPGVAGNIISATAEYYIKKDCFLVIATHLGHEIKNTLPEFSRIDGIEAKGLTEDFELIVDHNPVLGRLAHSTPELIVEKMAKLENTDYFNYLNDFLKK